MSKPLIAITGRNGQLGYELEKLAVTHADKFSFIFTGREELDIADEGSVHSFFEKYHPAYFINCAAYTAVDKAETEKEIAYKINAEANGVIAKQCNLFNCTLLLVSTDYVFNGTATTPYQPDDATDPVNYYGHTKWMGEQLALENNPHTIIVRTSWVYSSHGHNFVKTMLRLMKERESVAVVSDQVGSPTYAADLALALLTIIDSVEQGEQQYGMYHYQNAGVISWYDFAVAIKELAGLTAEVKPIATAAYPTAAKRPAYSVMDTAALQKDFAIKIRDWKTALRDCIDQLV